MDLVIPQPLQDLMLSKGDIGRNWLDKLPELIKKIEIEWQIQVGSVFPECYCNYVAPAKMTDGQNVVMKISFPDDEFFREVAYLKSHQGGPVATLLKVDESIPALLLERIDPANSLVAVDDKESIPIAAALLTELFKVQTPISGFKTTDDLFQEFLDLKKRFAAEELLPAEVIEKAEQAYRTLQLSKKEQIFLHGDLHQFNILFDHVRGWVAIDPSGIIGEKAYEVAALVKNPPMIANLPNLREILIERIGNFALLLNLDPKRIYLCTLFSTVLSVLWAYEDGTKIDDDFMRDLMKIASMLTSIDAETLLI